MAEATTEKPKHIIGIGKGMYTDLRDNKRKFAGDVSDIKGEGSSLEKFDKVIIRVYRSDRPSTRPGGRDMEGYVNSAQVQRILGQVNMGPDNAELANKNTAWDIHGQPDEYLWYLPAGKVKQGQDLKVECVWEPVNSRGKIVNHIYVMKIVLPE